MVVGHFTKFEKFFHSKKAAVRGHGRIHRKKVLHALYFSPCGTALTMYRLYFFWSQIPNIGQQEATQAVQTLADVATHHDLPHGLTAQPITMEMNPETGQVTTLPFSQGHQIILADDSSHIGGRL